MTGNYVVRDTMSANYIMSVNTDYYIVDATAKPAELLQKQRSHKNYSWAIL